MPDVEAAEFETSGYIRWASDLAAIPAKFGVTNVYAEIGTAFANAAVTNPRLAAGLLGTLIFGRNATPLYNLEENLDYAPIQRDTLDQMKGEYQVSGIGRSNVAYGYVSV